MLYVSEVFPSLNISFEFFCSHFRPEHKQTLYRLVRRDQENIIGNRTGRVRSGFFLLTSTATENKTQGQNSSLKLKEKTHFLAQL